MDVVFWLILLILLLGIETITVGLTTIWFAGGALVALILWGCGLNFWVQAFVFAIVSVILMIFTRPLAIKYINTNKLKTNYEGIIGKVVRVTKRVDNINGTGAAMVNGVEWTLRSTNDEIIIEEGTIVKVVDIKGVKLVVEEYVER